MKRSGVCVRGDSRAGSGEFFEDEFCDVDKFCDKADSVLRCNDGLPEGWKNGDIRASEQLNARS